MSANLRFPRGLYGVTPEWEDTDRLLDAIAQAAAGGMVALQWRRKAIADDNRLAQARRVMQRCRELNIIGIINDDWRLASMVDADGVHLGIDDGTVQAARQALGTDKIIGVSCYNDLPRARSMLTAGADYIAFGSIYPSTVKPDAVRADLDLLTQAKSLAVEYAPHGQRAAVVAIGGINADNLAAVVNAGADSAALISGLFDAENIQARAHDCQQLFVAQ
ncbi:MAG TPA: thiamine phosphate synthase [Burkholderiaceae bacterium]|nr:thiamine phosphate synthase [Burkholderiaceae bacterium]